MEGGVMKSRFEWVVWLVVLSVMGFAGQAGADHGLFASVDKATNAAGGFEMGCDLDDERRSAAEPPRVNGLPRQAALTRVACATGLASTWARENRPAPIPGRGRKMVSPQTFFLTGGGLPTSCQ